MITSVSLPPSGRSAGSRWRQKALGALTMLAVFGGSVPSQAQDVAAGQVRLDAVRTMPGFGHPLHVEIGTLPVTAGAGTEPATAGFLSYSALQAGKPRKGKALKIARPVIFAFNGGPGASAAYLHMGLLGPVLAHVPQDPAAPEALSAGALEGPASLYDVADVVFIDPPGTGFSERPEGAAAAPYSTVAGDAQACAELVKEWLARHGRLAAPIYILGESYGTIRAVGMLDALEALGLGTNVHGVVLLGQALNMIETSQRPDNVVTYAVSLPTLAAIACYHGRAKAGCTVPAITAEAGRFAREDYLPALYRGRDLPQADRIRLAARLEELTGISRTFYMENDLRISKERFRVELLRGQGKVLGRYDARYTAPRPADVTTMMPGDPASSISTIYGAAMSRYLADTLEVPDAQDYKVLARFEGGWSYGSADSPFADWPFMTTVEKHAASNACLRLFVGTGLYDTTTTIGAADYLFAQSSLPAARWRNERFEGGHVFYSVDASRNAFTAQLLDFLKADTCS